MRIEQQRKPWLHTHISSMSMFSESQSSPRYQALLERLLANAKNLTAPTSAYASAPPQLSASPFWCGPYYECNKTSGVNNWMLIYALPLFDYVEQQQQHPLQQLKQKTVLRGALMVKFRLNQIDVNQCERGDPVFADTHKCKPNSECVHIGAQVFKAGNYYCRCNKGTF